MSRRKKIEIPPSFDNAKVNPEPMLRQSPIGSVPAGFARLHVELSGLTDEVADLLNRLDPVSRPKTASVQLTDTGLTSKCLAGDKINVALRNVQQLRMGIREALDRLEI